MALPKPLTKHEASVKRGKVGEQASPTCGKRINVLLPEGAADRVEN